jgi:predicted house-cleaning noncanonical NTP pyrophosphatase (MazG superfamily)
MASRKKAALGSTPLVNRKRIYYRKLVRDNFPEIICQQGGAFFIRTLNKKELIDQLLLKVGEEANALPHTRTKKELIAEIADVLDVIDEIFHIKKISREELKAAQQANEERKGGFCKRLFLIWASDTGYRTNERKGKRS